MSDQTHLFQISSYWAGIKNIEKFKESDKTFT